jgi:hypothetical protein
MYGRKTDKGHEGSGSHGPGGASASQPAPGRRTLVETIQRSPGGPGSPTHQPADPPPSIAGTGSGGPLPDDVRAKMEGAFGTDFSQVRVHEGAHVERVGARAYTQGSDIHFAPGQYHPGSSAGQELLGHELTHVVQQGQGRVAATRQAKGVHINDDPGLEREADEMGARAARSEPVNIAAGARAPATGAAATAPLQGFGFGGMVDLQGPIDAAMQAAYIALWLEPMQSAAQLRQARLDVTATAAGAPFHLGAQDITMDDQQRRVLLDAVRRRVMARVVAVRAPFKDQLRSEHDAARRRAIQDQMRTATRPFLDELRDPAQPGARFEADPDTQREVLAALELDGEGHAEDELADQNAHGDAGPRARARQVAGLPQGAWCGAFAYTQQHAAGLSDEARVAMQSTGPSMGIDAFLDYTNHSQVIWTGSAWQPVRDYHDQRGSLRLLVRLPATPTPVTPGGVYAPNGLDIQPGDIVLIDNFRGTYADHITQCRSYDSATGQLETIAGNEGSSPGRVAASATPRDLNDNPRAQTVAGYDKPSRVYAYGRFSIVDYEVHTYLQAMPADPTVSPEAMAARQTGGGAGGR